MFPMQAAQLFELPRLLDLAEWRARSDLCLQSCVRLANLAYRRHARQLLNSCVYFLTVSCIFFGSVCTWIHLGRARHSFT